MQKKTRKIIILILLVLTVMVGGFGAILYKAGLMPRYDRDHTLHSPIFSNGGSNIYFISRRTSGISWGPGIEFFTPPAKVIFLSDRFQLNSIDIKTKGIKILHTWKIPHDSEPKLQYRNWLFGVPGTELIIMGGKIHFKIGLDVFKDNVPYAKYNEWLVGYYDIENNITVETKHWEQSSEMPNQWPEEILFGDLEVMNYKNKAILIHNSKTNDINVLLKANTEASVSDEFVKTINLSELSYRKQLERLRILRETNASLIERFKKEGYPEIEAHLRAGDELEKMGLYPKSPKIKAKSVAKAGGDFVIFKITKEEFAFGLFPDIEKALQKEGEEIHFWGNYIRHRDYDTSDKINAYLSKGHSSFYVMTDGRAYLLTIER